MPPAPSCRKIPMDGALRLTTNRTESSSPGFDQAIPPFLKWAGGKRWLAPLIASLIDRTWIYHEPFLGSGACFFRICPNRSHLTDVNADLIRAFRAVQTNPDSVSRLLDSFNISLKTFDLVKKWEATSDSETAARLIYLNRTAFAGLYRVNRLGHFNVPFGCKLTTTLPTRALLREWSARLAGAIIAQRDFEHAMRDVKRWHLVYVDPPYTAKHTNGTFRRYNETLFSWKDQERLAQASIECVERGARVLVSNARSSEVTRLYPRRLFDRVELARPSNLAANPKYRGYCTELLLASRNMGLRGRTLQRIRSQFGTLFPRVSRSS